MLSAAKNLLSRLDRGQERRFFFALSMNGCGVTFLNFMSLSCLPPPSSRQPLAQRKIVTETLRARGTCDSAQNRRIMNATDVMSRRVGRYRCDAGVTR